MIHQTLTASGDKEVNQKIALFYHAKDLNEMMQILYLFIDKLEKEYSIYFNDSPTQSIYYNIMNKLEKVTHNHPMLSLAKTKIEKDKEDFLKKIMENEEDKSTKKNNNLQVFRNNYKCD